MDRERLASILAERLKTLGRQRFDDLLESRNIKTRSLRRKGHRKKVKGCTMVPDPRFQNYALGIPGKLAERILILGYFA